MSLDNENQPTLQLLTPTPTLPNDHNDNQVIQYFNFCLDAQTFDDLCSRLAKIPLSLRIHVYEALYIHFQSNPNTYFFDVSLLGIFFSTVNCKESSTVISDHVKNILQQPSFNKFKEQFCLITLNLRAEVHWALFHKALWSHKQTYYIKYLNISTDLYGTDIQLTEADQEANHFQNSLFDAADEFSFIAQFRQIPLQYRSLVHKILLHTVQQDQQSAEFCGWVSTIQAADLYLNFDDIAKGISEKAHIYANACFCMSPGSHSAKASSLKLPLAIGGQVYQVICFRAFSLSSDTSFFSRYLSYLTHKPGLRKDLDKLLNALNYDAFITDFLAIDRSQRIQTHNDLYFYTKSDLVKYKEQFDWVLQSTHPYHFVSGFNDDLESESNQAVKCAHDFIANPGHRDSIFSQFSQFTEHSSRFKFCLILGSKTSYEWMSSHIDLQRYIDPLYPELVSATEEVKECVGRCLLAPNLGEFKVAFHSIPFSMRHEVYNSLFLYKDFYHKKQQAFLNDLHPLEISINVNHYISDDQLAIYATACSSATNTNNPIKRLSIIPYPIRTQIYKLTLTQAKFHFNTDSIFDCSNLWELPASISLIPQVDDCFSSDSFDQFKSRFLSIPRQLRLEAYEALYAGTQNDQSKFIWLLQCTHPYYFLDGFDDFKSESDAKFSETFLVHFDRGDVYDTFTRLPQSSRFDLFLKLASQVSHTWLISHTDKLPRYLSCLYPELVSATEEVKECVGRCLLAPNLGEFKVAFHSIPFSMRHEVYNSLFLYKDFYHKKQQAFLNDLHPLEISINVNHYISDDQLAIYATAFSCASSIDSLIRHLFTAPYPIRVQIYKSTLVQISKLTSVQQKFNSSTDFALRRSHLWKASAGFSPTPQVDDCLSSDSFDQFKLKFLSIPRQLRSKAYQALYVATQNDRSKFIWLLQCSHPYYFLDGFKDSDIDDGDINDEEQRHH